MRQSLPGDNKYLLATGGQRGAKGSAKGRSVVLVHRVLGNWLCENSRWAAGVTPPTGMEYTQDSVLAVKAFQEAYGLPMDGIVGPDTIRVLDFYVADGPVASPFNCRGEDENRCPEREPDEEVDSHKGWLQVEYTDTPDAAYISITGFGVNDESVDRLVDIDQSAIERRLNRQRVETHVADSVVRCLSSGIGTVFGFADCHEEPALADNRAEKVGALFSDYGLVTRHYPPTSNVTAAQRRNNRAVSMLVPKIDDNKIDLRDELDGLLYVYSHERSSLLGSWSPKVIRLADQLLKGPTVDDEYLDSAAAHDVGSRIYPRGCIYGDEWPWLSATDEVRSQLFKLNKKEICRTGSVGGLDELRDALAVLDENMVGGITRLFYLGSLWAIAGDSSGCGCVGLKEIWDRTLRPNSIYYALRDHRDFGDWNHNQSCNE